MHAIHSQLADYGDNALQDSKKRCTDRQKSFKN